MQLLSFGLKSRHHETELVDFEKGFTKTLKCIRRSVQLSQLWISFFKIDWKLILWTSASIFVNKKLPKKGLKVTIIRWISIFFLKRWPFFYSKSIFSFLFFHIYLFNIGFNNLGYFPWNIFVSFSKKNCKNVVLVCL